MDKTRMQRQASFQFPAKWVAMAKKSLVRYVSEIRKELLAKNRQGAVSVSDCGTDATTAVKASDNTIDSSASGPRKRKPDMKHALSSVLILCLTTLLSAITASAASKGQQAAV